MTNPANSNIAAAYDQWAETYDVDQNRTRDLAAEALKQTELNFADRRVIEIGCGTGRNTEWLTQSAAGPASILAVDFSEAMLARARERVQDARVKFIQHDAREPWPRESGSVDIVIAMLILEHVEQLQPVFREAARVLIPGGEFFLCELHPMRQLTGGQAQFSNTKTGERQCVTAYIHDVSEYVNTALSAGFELKHLGEWRDAEAAANTPPRLLSLVLQKS
ncbi:MAG TPA: methyltransferase domain-containing protein [Pyrinomonadaceae bacterium]|nr:methyltransferase domain-containing protein [Pyrinomonadaceae bacterium]